MRVLKTSERLGGPCCAALGYFDGVHIGHEAVIKSAAKRAHDMGVKLAVFTFSFDSARLTGKGREDLFAESERINRIAELGVDVAYVLPFSEICTLTPERFAKRVLLEMLSAKEVFAGEDFTFGAGGEGNAEALSVICRQYEIKANICKTVTEAGRKVSSSEIKTLIKSGEIEQANAMLCMPYGFSLPVVHGDGRGASLGFATANQQFPAGVVIPRFGVYMTRATIDGKSYSAITNVGVRPTFDKGGDPVAETSILDFEGDIYEKYMRLEFLSFIRPEKKFKSEQALESQVKDDIARVRKMSQSPKRMQGKGTGNMVSAGILMALIAAMTVIPFTGYINYGGIEITTLHIPVIIGAVLLGKWYGALLGGFWGITCLVRAFTNPLWIMFTNPLISVLPRIMVGFVAGALMAAFKNSSHRALGAGISAGAASVTNTALVLGAISLFGGMSASYGSFFEYFKTIISVLISVNGLIELAAAIIIVPAVYVAVTRDRMKK